MIRGCTATNFPWSVNLRIYLAFTLLAMGIVWLTPLFPTQDGPSHVYNLVILHDLRNGGTEWGRVFSYCPRLTPNLGFHMVAYPLLALFGPSVVEKTFVSIYIILMSTAVPFYLRAFGRDTFPLSFLAFPFLFNYALMMGFYSFSLAVPCMLWAIAVSWLIRDRSLLARLITFNLFGFAIYYMHLIPFAIYLLSLFLMIAISGNRGRRLKDFLVLAVLLSPSLINFALYILPSFSRPARLPAPAYSFSRFTELLAGLPILSSTRWQLLLWIILFLLLLLSMAASISESKGQRRSLDRESIFISALTISMLLIYFTFPYQFGGGSCFHERLPWVIGLLLLPLLPVPAGGMIGRRRTLLFAGIALMFLVSEAVVLRGQSDMVAEFLGGLGTKQRKGAIMATVKEFRPGWSKIDPLLHAAAYYGVANNWIYTGNYEAYTSYFPTRFRTPLPDIPPLYQLCYRSDEISWSRYPAVEYLLAWDIDEVITTKLWNDYDRILVNKRFSLWHRRTGAGK